MKKRTFLVAISIVLMIFLLVNFNQVQSSAGTKVNDKKDTKIIKTISSDINGDKVLEKINIVGRGQSKDAWSYDLFDNFELRVYKNNKLLDKISFDCIVSMFDISQFKAADIDNDGINDIFISLHTGGSDNVHELLIYKFNKNKLREVKEKYYKEVCIDPVITKINKKYILSVKSGKKEYKVDVTHPGCNGVDENYDCWNERGPAYDLVTFGKQVRLKVTYGDHYWLCSINYYYLFKGGKWQFIDYDIGTDFPIIKKIQNESKSKSIKSNLVANWKVNASSSLLRDHKIDHTPNLVIDNKVNTAWVEGAKGNGVGEWIQLSSDKVATLSGIEIVAGYAKSSNLFKQNNRIKKIEISFSNGTSVVKTLKDNIMGFQKINFSTPVTSKIVKIKILDVYKGSKYNDTCISEIKLLTYKK